MIYTAVKVLLVISAIGPVMFGVALLLILPLIVAVIYRIPAVRESWAFMRMARTIAVAVGEDLRRQVWYGDASIKLPMPSGAGICWD